MLTVTGSIQHNRNLAPASSKPMFSLMLSCNDDDDNDTPDTSKLYCNILHDDDFVIPNRTFRNPESGLQYFLCPQFTAAVAVAS